LYIKPCRNAWLFLLRARIKSAITNEWIGYGCIGDGLKIKI